MLKQIVEHLTPVMRPSGGTFDWARYQGQEGSLSYRLFVPTASALAQGRRPLIVMLHGCGQDPDDFALGTQMNALALKHNLVLAYPLKPRAGGGQGCWEWYRPQNQMRGGGEPALLAGMIDSLTASALIDPRRVYVAGLSAGAAAAANLARAYPEKVAGLGLHSGLPLGAARSLTAAMAAMRFASGPGEDQDIRTPTIIFHGTADRAVAVGNARHIGRQVTRWAGPTRLETQRLRSASGRFCRREVHRLPGRPAPLCELWTVEGAGHAWQGGAPEGRFTDPSGPDASAEMVRFFLSQSRLRRERG